MAQQSDQGTVVDTFMNQYERWEHAHCHYYATAAKRFCKDLLQEGGIQGVVTCRAKELESLEKKIRNRGKENSYPNPDAIRADILDLSGARIALYYPDQKAEVQKLLKQNFEIKGSNKDGKDGKEPRGKKVVETKEREKYEKRFFDYEGDHYYVKIPSHRLEKQYMDKPHTVEIQVVTVIASAWSQVEHDILYKKITGSPTRDECRILDQVNGLVHMGELLLEQLYRNHQARLKLSDTRFIDKYDLGSFLRKWVLLNPERVKPNINLGPVRALYTLLMAPALNLATPKQLEKVLECLFPSGGTDSLGDQKEPYKKSLSLCVMKKLHDENRPASALSSPLPKNNGYQAISIIASTALWLGELFRGADWDYRLIHDGVSNSGEVKSNLRWLFFQADRYRNVIGIWLDGDDPENEATARIQALWTWLLEHGNPEVKFVFNLSCLGMLKDPRKSTEKLRNLGFYLNDIEVI